MPYFVFEVREPRSLRCVDSFDRYRDARGAVREMRAGLASEEGVTARMIFAADAAQAERLLLEKREPRPLGEDA